MANEGQKDINNNTWAVQNSTVIAVVQNTTYYSYPTDWITPTRITYANLNIPETSLIQLDSLNSNTAWETYSAPAPPQYYFIKNDSQNIGIYPFISTFTASTPLDYLRVKYVCQPTDMVLTSDVPFNGIIRLYPYHTLIILYVSYRVYLIEGEMDKAGGYLQEYTSRLGTMNQNTGKKPNYIPSFSGPANSR